MIISNRQQTALLQMFYSFVAGIVFFQLDFALCVHLQSAWLFMPLQILALPLGFAVYLAYILHERGLKWREIGSLSIKDILIGGVTVVALVTSFQVQSTLMVCGVWYAISEAAILVVLLFSEIVFFRLPPKKFGTIIATVFMIYVAWCVFIYTPRRNERVDEILKEQQTENRNNEKDKIYTGIFL